MRFVAKDVPQPDSGIAGNWLESSETWCRSNTFDGERLSPKPNSVPQITAISRSKLAETVGSGKERKQDAGIRYKWDSLNDE